ncbi:MAG: hypothetical protein E7301_13925 [Butyrivibrio sp.]|nr:hypothetical protein [Butyrivibrio sp.]
MYNEFYRLAGEIIIPEEKKEEFNNNVLKLLDRCGIRKIKKKKIDGIEIELAARVKPDKKGIVHFDYSIFENKVREESTYDLNTCSLEVNDPGFNEMGMAMAMIMTLTEAYSLTPCYMIRDGEMVSIDHYALITEDILGIRLRFPNRADIWSMYMFSRDSEDIQELKGIKISEQVPHDFEKVDYGVFINMLYIDRESLFKEHLIEIDFTKEQVGTFNGGEKDNCLYSLMLNLGKKDKALLKDYVQRLVGAPLEERTIYSEEDSEFGTLAELSRYYPAQALVLMYEIVMDTDFWTEWERFTKQGFYSDRIMAPGDIDEEEEHRVLHFYKAIRRLDDDEALGEFGDRKLSISQDMKDAISEWKEQAESASFQDDYDPIEELKSLLVECKETYGIKRMDYDLFSDLKRAPEKETTLKVLFLLRFLLDDGINLFPELTREQAKSWIIKRCRSEFDKQKINGLLGLLANQEKRMELLGF